MSIRRDIDYCRQSLCGDHKTRTTYAISETIINNNHNVERYYTYVGHGQTLCASPLATAHCIDDVMILIALRCVGHLSCGSLIFWASEF